MTPAEAIRKAIDVLTIQDVYLRESKLSLAPDYDPKHATPPMLTNLGWGSRRGQVLEVEDVATKKKLTLWKVEFAVRCRLLKSIEPAPKDDYEPKPEDILASIEAIYVAEYLLKDPSIDQEALAEFAKHNVAYHVWPYWREYIHDVTARALLPRITLPMHVFRPGTPKSADIISKT